MPLSDHEQRLLEQMERALYQEDPKFASSLRHGRSGGLDRKRVATGTLGAVIGLVVVLAGVVVSLPIVGVAGFAIMVAGSFWAWSGTRKAEPEAGSANAPAGQATTGRAKPAGQSAFMSKMEQRWRNRREGDQRPQ